MLKLYKIYTIEELPEKIRFKDIKYTFSKVSIKQRVSAPRVMFTKHNDGVMYCGLGKQTPRTLYLDQVRSGAFILKDKYMHGLVLEGSGDWFTLEISNTLDNKIRVTSYLGFWDHNTTLIEWCSGSDNIDLKYSNKFEYNDDNILKVVNELSTYKYTSVEII